MRMTMTTRTANPLKRSSKVMAKARARTREKMARAKAKTRARAKVKTKGKARARKARARARAKSEALQESPLIPGAAIFYGFGVGDISINPQCASRKAVARSCETPVLF